MPYEFEHDPVKSQSNKLKHGIDFDQAQSLWSDLERVEIQAISATEPRLMVIGKWQQKHWSAIVTDRNQVIRIISVRCSRDNEVA